MTVFPMLRLKGMHQSALATCFADLRRQWAGAKDLREVELLYGYIALKRFDLATDKPSTY